MAADQMGGLAASRIGRRPDGSLFCVDVFLQYSKPMTLPVAVERAKAGKTVFVLRSDAPAVLDALAVTGGCNAERINGTA